MLPAASVVHDLPGRTRFRVIGKRGDPQYFALLERELGGHDGVRSVIVNEMTGSVLVVHDLTAAEVGSNAKQASLFELRERERADAAELSPSQTMSARLLDLDRRLRSATDGAMDLEETIFVALCAGAALQALRGRVLPPGLTLLSFAAQVLDRLHSRSKVGAEIPSSQ